MGSGGTAGGGFAGGGDIGGGEDGGGGGDTLGCTSAAPRLDGAASGANPVTGHKSVSQFALRAPVLIKRSCATLTDWGSTHVQLGDRLDAARWTEHWNKTTYIISGM